MLDVRARARFMAWKRQYLRSVPQHEEELEVTLDDGTQHQKFAREFHGLHRKPVRDQLESRRTRVSRLRECAGMSLDAGDRRLSAGRGSACA